MTDNKKLIEFLDELAKSPSSFNLTRTGKNKAKEIACILKQQLQPMGVVAEYVSKLTGSCPNEMHNWEPLEGCDTICRSDNLIYCECWKEYLLELIENYIQKEIKLMVSR